MEAKFIKDYYNKLDKDGNMEDKGKLYPMYHFEVYADYFEGNKQKVLAEGINDIEKLLERMKAHYKENEEQLDSWDSISK